jgi:predicted permease
LDTLFYDVRNAFRALAGRPLYTVVTILVFAIAIGANTTVFSVLNAFLLRALPYPEGDRLVMVYDSYPKVGVEVAGTAIPDYVERRAQASSLEDLAIVTASARALGGSGAPEQITVGRASPSLFSVLRVSPTLGRAFGDAEATIGSDQVVLLSHDLWRVRFGARADVIGTDIKLDGEPVRVIGVLPERFNFGTFLGAGKVDVWMPFAFTPQQLTDAERGRQFSISVGRLRPGATVVGLTAELDAIVRRNVETGHFSREGRETTGFTGKALPLRSFEVGPLGSMLLLLQATVLAVLLIACANVANLQLARVTARRKELALRAALGAGAHRLVRLVLVESSVLALLGAALGLALAIGGIDLVRALGVESGVEGVPFEMEANVLAFTFGAAAFAALVSGLPPVVALLRSDLSRVVNDAGRGGRGGRGVQALRGGLVVAQIGMSVALLTAAGLLTKSFIELQAEGPGFQAGGVWTAQIELPRTRYPQAESWPRFQSRVLEQLRALPGVREAAFTNSLPFAGGNNQGSIAIDGYVLPSGESPPHAQSWVVSETYFSVLEIPLLQGRNFVATEPERVAIVDENFAARYWPGRSAIGQRVRQEIDPADQWYTIVGVVPPVKQGSLAEQPRKETVYWYYKQRTVDGGSFAVRTALPPEELTRAATSAVRALDPDLAVFDVQPMERRIASSLGPQRTPMVLTLVFAAIAFALAVIGIYAMLDWAVSQRIGEIGVRAALGARPGDIVRMVLLQGGRLIAIGVAIGIAAAWVLGAVLASQVRNVSALDPAVLAIAVGSLGAAALLATWLPARRASRIDPLRALRQE